jgi:hypothetical protein
MRKQFCVSYFAKESKKVQVQESNEEKDRTGRNHLKLNQIVVPEKLITESETIMLVAMRKEKMIEDLKMFRLIENISDKWKLN